MIFNILKLTILINRVFASEQQDNLSKKDIKILKIDPENSIMNQYLPFENYNYIYDLSFENNQEIEFIPDNIKYLVNLNSLNIKGTNIRNLPYEFIRRIKTGLKLTVDPEFQEYGEGDTMGYREIMSKLASKCTIEGIEHKPNNYTREEIKTLFEKAPLHWNFDFFCKTCGVGEHFVESPVKSLIRIWQELNNFKIKSELRVHLDMLVYSLYGHRVLLYLEVLSNDEKLGDKEESVKIVDLSKHYTPKCTSKLAIFTEPIPQRMPTGKIDSILEQILYFIFDEIKTYGDLMEERIAFILNVIETSLLKSGIFLSNIKHIYNMTIKSDESGDEKFLEKFIKTSIFTEQFKLMNLANVGGNGSVLEYMKRICSGNKIPVVKGNSDAPGPSLGEPYCIKTDEEALYALLSKMTPRHAIDVLKVSINTNRDARRILTKIIKNDRRLIREQRESFFVKEGEEYCSLHVRKLQSNLFKKGRSFLNYREAKDDINEKGIEYFLLKKKWLINKST